MRHRPQSGQAMVEFALVFGLFLLCFFPIIDAWLWSIQGGAASTATEQGIAVALSASSSSISTTSGVNQVYVKIAPQLKTSMVGTVVEDWDVVRHQAVWTGFPPRCPGPDEIANRVGNGHVIICALNNNNGTVTVAIAGCPPSLTPPMFSIGGCGGAGLPIAEQATVRVGTYTT